VWVMACVQLAPPDMPDGPFSRLVSRWADKAVSVVIAKPIAGDGGRALAVKLRVFARLVEELDGSNSTSASGQWRRLSSKTSSEAISGGRTCER
jgi:hypothetical protein